MPAMLAPPPRHVPLSLKAINACNMIAQIGWFVFGFGMIFVWAFMGNADFSFLTFRGPHAHSAGRVTSVAATGASENDQPVVAHHYEYFVGGQRYLGTSYTTQGSRNNGDTVEVEYDEKNPAKSRIAGMRRAQFGPFVSFVAIFALIGFGVLYFGMRSGLRRNRVLRTGLLSMGTLVAKEPTNVTVNKRPVWKLTFEFVGRDGRKYEADAHTTDTARLEDEAQEPLLYDPDEPSRAYVLDEAPARPQFEPNGELRGRPLAGFASLIVPAIVIAGNLLALAIKLDLLF